MPIFARILAVITIVAGLMCFFGALTAGDLWPAFVGAGMAGLVTGAGLHLLADLVDAVRASRREPNASDVTAAAKTGDAPLEAPEQTKPFAGEDNTSLATVVGWSVVVGVMLLIGIFAIGNAHQQQP